MKNLHHVFFLVSGIAKLQRERSLFCPRLFREEAAHPNGWAANLAVVESSNFLKIIIVEPGGPRRVALAWAPCTF